MIGKLDSPNYIELYKQKLQEDQYNLKVISDKCKKVWDELLPYFLDFGNQLSVQVINRKDLLCKKPYIKIIEYCYIRIYIFNFNSDADYEFKFSDWDYPNDYNLLNISKSELIERLKMISFEILGLK